MEKINKLKRLFNVYRLDGYIIPKNDEFFSEYVPRNKDRLKFISNFSGSFGIALILKNRNYLFVDSRYTLQAKIQSGKHFNIVTIPGKLPKNILKNKKLKIGFDSKLHTDKNLKDFFGQNSCKLISIHNNLIDKIWKNRKNVNLDKFYLMPKNATGQNSKSKISKLINILKRKKVDLQFISASENIAWLLNIRGKDTEFSPIPNSYLVIESKKKITLFCDLKKIKQDFKKKFKEISFVDIKHTNITLSKYNKKKYFDRSSLLFYIF